MKNLDSVRFIEPTLELAIDNFPNIINMPSIPDLKSHISQIQRRLNGTDLT